PSSKTRNAFCGRPVTYLVPPSVTVTVTSTRSTSTVSTNPSPFVLMVATARASVPSAPAATTRTRCSTIARPASHSHSYGALATVHTWRPSTKNDTITAASVGSTCARSTVDPLM